MASEYNPHSHRGGLEPLVHLHGRWQGRGKSAKSVSKCGQVCETNAHLKHFRNGRTPYFVFTRGMTSCWVCIHRSTLENGEKIVSNIIAPIRKSKGGSS